MKIKMISYGPLTRLEVETAPHEQETLANQFANHGICEIDGIDIVSPSFCTILTDKSRLVKGLSSIAETEIQMMPERADRIKALGNAKGGDIRRTGKAMALKVIRQWGKN
jgi:hypothetical protein